MKYYLNFIIFLFSSLIAFSQSTNKETSLSVEFGRNIHGSGDIPGFQFGLRYNQSLNKRFDLIIAAEGNINDNEARPFTWEDGRGNTFDGTIHNVIAGFQLNVGVGLNIVNSSKHKFGFNPSIHGRYQATSLFDALIIDYPILTGLDFPIRFEIREQPGRTLALGWSGRLYYHYRFSSKHLAGLNVGIQNDTNGDTIMLATLSFGWRL